MLTATVPLDRLVTDTPAPLRKVTRKFRRDTLAPKAARTFTADFLAAHHIDDDTIDTARLLISELVTNAACYANRGDITITIKVCDKQVKFTVIDAGRASAAAGVAACEHDNESEHGRGWDLVVALSAERGIERRGGGNGNQAWFVLNRDSGGAK